MEVTTFIFCRAPHRHTSHQDKGPLNFCIYIGVPRNPLPGGKLTAVTTLLSTIDKNSIRHPNLTACICLAQKQQQPLSPNLRSVSCRFAAKALLDLSAASLSSLERRSSADLKCGITRVWRLRCTLFMPPFFSLFFDHLLAAIAWRGVQI